MSAIGPKQTWADAPHMSAFKGKADQTCCGSPLARSLHRRIFGLFHGTAADCYDATFVARGRP